MYIDNEHNSVRQFLSICVRNKSDSYCGWSTKTHNFPRLELVSRTMLGGGVSVGGKEIVDKRVEKIKFDLELFGGGNWARYHLTFKIVVALT